jgi:hypothetical protein
MDEDKFDSAVAAILRDPAVAAILRDPAVVSLFAGEQVNAQTQMQFNFSANQVNNICVVMLTCVFNRVPLIPPPHPVTKQPSNIPKT